MRVHVSIVSGNSAQPCFRKKQLYDKDKKLFYPLLMYSVEFHL
jgi:hypothetical protein